MQAAIVVTIIEALMIGLWLAVVYG